MPLISVITATYNRFDRIFETIQSVLDQDYPQIEYLITDDGSANCPAREIEAYVQQHKRDNLKHFELIRHEKNVGTVRNLNQAYKTAKGAYFIEVAGDDVFHDSSVVRHIVERFLSRDSDVIVTSRLAVDEQDQPVMLLPHYYEREKILRLNTAKKQYYALTKGMFYDMASGSAMYYSRRIMERLNYFDEEYRLWEDGPFLYKYTWEQPLDCYYELISIRYHLGGVSSRTMLKPVTSSALQEDHKKLHTYEYPKHYDEMPRSIQRYVDYGKKLSLCPSRKDKLKVYLRHPVMCGRYVLYNFSRKYYQKRDRAYLKKGELV